MRDSQIRAALLHDLVHKYNGDDNTILLEELGLRHGETRMDLVIINDILHGYEVKSDRDSLRRLPNQARVFSLVFDRITLIVGYRHAGEALSMIPPWWGVRLAHMDDRGKVRFSPARSSQKNPSPDKEALAMLLWKEEALDFLNEFGEAENYRSKPRSEIYRRLAILADHDLIRAKVCERLKSRIDWRSAERQMLNGD